MAAVPLVGTTGSVTLPNSVTTVYLRAWSATSAQGVVDVTGFSSAGWAERVGTLKSLTGSASGQVDTAKIPITSALTGTPASMTLQLATSQTYTGSAVISNFTVSQVVEGVATCNFDFVSSGAWS